MITKGVTEIGGGKSITFSANGESFIGITDITGAAKIEKFYQLCLERDDEICRIVHAAKIKREWNYAHQSKAKNWPEFTRLERLRNELCKQCGIKDS